LLTVHVVVELGEVLVTARNVDSYWERAIQKLAAVEPRYDIPLAILYKVEDDREATAPNAPEARGPAKICRLAGTLGVPENHPIAPESINLRTSNEALSSSLREAIAAQHPTLLQTSDGTLPPSLLEGLQWRGFEGDPCRAAVICPIRPTKEEDVRGFLLLGINPRRPYDNDYRQYISLLSQKLATSLASIVLLEEEARRGRNAAEQAAFDQAMLQEKLEVQTKEANESMQKFEAVAEFVPIGLCLGDETGNITYANDAWYKITGYPGTAPISNQGFLSCVKKEDRSVVTAGYDKLKTVRNVEFEFRVRRQPNAATTDLTASLTRTSPSFEKAGLDLVSLEDLKERHVLAMARAEYNPDGSVLRVLTCLTDVSAMRATAEEATRRAQQAENLKRMAEFATVGMYDMDLRTFHSRSFCPLMNVICSRPTTTPMPHIRKDRTDIVKQKDGSSGPTRSFLRCADCRRSIRSKSTSGHGNSASVRRTSPCSRRKSRGWCSKTRCRMSRSDSTPPGLPMMAQGTKLWCRGRSRRL
jgi:PAS domain S-box-containing protein